MTAGSVCDSAVAGIMYPNDAGYEHYTDFGSTFAIANGGRVGFWKVEFTHPTTGLRSTSRASGVLLNSYTVLMSGHQVRPYLGLDPEFSFSTGDNFLTDTGTSFDVDLANISVHPDYIGQRTAPDFAVVRFAQAIADVSELIIGGPLAAGAELILAGFGRPAIWGAPYMQHDGALRAGISTVDRLLIPDHWEWPNELYSLAHFWPPPNGYYNGMRGTPGDSGGAVFDRLTGNLTGLIIGGSDDTLGMSTIYLDLHLQQDFINAHKAIGPAAVPEPSSLTLVAISGFALAGASLRRRRSGRQAPAKFDHSTLKMAPQPCVIDPRV